MATVSFVVGTVAHVLVFAGLGLLALKEKEQAKK